MHVLMMIICVLLKNKQVLQEYERVLTFIIAASSYTFFIIINTVLKYFSVYSLLSISDDIIIYTFLF